MTVIDSKTKIIKRKKVSRSPKKNDSGKIGLNRDISKKTATPKKPLLVLSNSDTKKSVHTINLKNPSGSFALNQTVKNDFTPINNQKILPIKPPKVIPKQRAEINVNFIPKTNLLSELSLVKLFKFISKLVKGLTRHDDEFITPEKRMGIKIESDLLTRPSTEEIEDIFAPIPTHRLLNFKIEKKWYKTVGVFAIMSLILVLPFQALSYFQQLQNTKDNVLLLTDEAINSLKDGQQYAASLDLWLAGQRFDQAKNNFISAQAEANKINAVTTEILKLIPGQGKTMQAGLELLKGGEIMSEVGQILSQAGQDFLGSQGSDYYKSLQKSKTSLKLGMDKFWEAKKIIQNVLIKDLPENNQFVFEQVLQSLPLIENGLTDLYSLNSAILKILGQDQWQRYLLIFANNNELRASGGFMGSFALLDIDQGQIKNLEIPGGGTYDLQGWLKPKIISPEPLHLINPRWEFQDSNWWSDFPKSASKMQWFYQNAGGASTDGVILMTATLMENLLEVLGPVEMPDYGRVIDNENFVAETQKIVELEYDKEENRPKQFIADLAPELIERIFSASGDQLKDLLAILQQGLNEKNLLLYFNDDQAEKIILSLDWGGKIKDTQGDYLSIIHTNLAGGKTDSVIDQAIFHQAEVLDDGSIIDTVTLTRTHNGIKGENIFTGVQNNSYVRFYVPAGSVLLKAEGFEKPPLNLFKQPDEDLTKDIDLISIETDKTIEKNSGTDIYKESGKTVFGNWLQLKPGETKQAVIQYKLPFKLAEQNENTFYYSLMVQKQAGATNGKISSQLILNDQLKPLTKYPTTLSEENGHINFNQNLTTDQFYGVVLINQ